MSRRHIAPIELLIKADGRLRVFLGYYRDGLNAGSAFYRFLAFWNALDVACDDYQGRLPAWLNANVARWWEEREGGDPVPKDAWEYFAESGRHAIAHAVRDPGRGPEIDPDDPDDRERLARDANLMQLLAIRRLMDRWGEGAVQKRLSD